MTWYERILKKNKKEIILSAVFVFALALITTLWHYFTGKSFEWQNISPIEEPALLPRLFYSALVYVTLGWFLFHKLKFWKFLYEPYRGGGRRAYREYEKLKAAIWGLLILLMYFVIVPFVVGILNTIISFFFNLYILLLYLAAPLAISLTVCGLGLFVYKKHNALKRSS